MNEAILRVHTEYDKELVFYRSFHQHPVNWRIHALAVPLEWWSFLLAAAGVHFALPWAIALGAAGYYLLLSSKKKFLVHISAALAQVVMAFAATRVAFEANSVRSTLLWAGIVHVLSWSLQVGIGHWFIEKNNPGMATQLTTNSVVLSPLLAWADFDSCP
uniref:DUF962 domain-containing protein n=1 Tax=Lotharella oceanica TaxID=641309 RepID=A0A7S2U3A4_9EUKA|mmetsp:Transcript_8267/g.16236  ORF Transcript_8267/g.16236 Transcript_8267/m.16236 type:complete len:160 (+) Transcript_8267:53-532(+)|eukprot:CAMPEP_0170184838 /NCGR_PEP_ID=MMETSP0040_2-20121228/34790_1 /TAXON_ID=641309 /ORGANISM="Lotharella oceanica, Strain CCMP622" /LENGTH=159 /DNA_ID=CAMNT_0010431027 /DNA_START=63 /DNA_END=542 /DNA_ORIENTATION=-